MFDFVSVQSEFDFQPIESELDSNTKKETCSEQIEIKHETDYFIYGEAFKRIPGQEYSDNNETSQITGHIENDNNSWLEIKLEPTR